MEYLEIELNKVVTAKRINMDRTYESSDYQYVREFYTNMGYEVGNIRFC